MHWIRLTGVWAISDLVLEGRITSMELTDHTMTNWNFTACSPLLESVITWWHIFSHAFTKTRVPPEITFLDMCKLMQTQAMFGHAYVKRKLSQEWFFRNRNFLYPVCILYWASWEQVAIKVVLKGHHSFTLWYCPFLFQSQCGQGSCLQCKSIYFNRYKPQYCKSGNFHLGGSYESKAAKKPKRKM